MDMDLGGPVVFFCKEPDSKYFQLCRSYDLYHSHSALSLRISKHQEWLCFIKTLFTQTGHKLDSTRPGLGLLLYTIPRMIVVKMKTYLGYFPAKTL